MSGEFSRGVLEWLVVAVIVTGVAWLLGVVGAKVAMKNMESMA